MGGKQPGNDAFVGHQTCQSRRTKVSPGTLHRSSSAGSQDGCTKVGRGNSGHFNVATGKEASIGFLLLVSCRQVESLDIHGQKFA